MSNSGPLDPVESLTVRLGQLELTITVRQVDHNTGPLPALTVVPPGSNSAGYQVSQNTWNHSALAPSYPRGLDQAALASDRPRDLAALDLRFLGALTNQLTGSDQVWTADARLGRAFRAGCLARLRLDGEYRAEDSWYSLPQLLLHLSERPWERTRFLDQQLPSVRRSCAGESSWFKCIWVNIHFSGISIESRV